jgi:hypothetical protein
MTGYKNDIEQEKTNYYGRLFLVLCFDDIYFSEKKVSFSSIREFQCQWHTVIFQTKKFFLIFNRNYF